VDKHPITHTNQKFILPEAPVSGDTVGTVTKMLRTYPSWHKLYYGTDVTAGDFSAVIVGGNSDGAFSINSATGDLTINTPINFTASREITVQISLTGTSLTMNTVCQVDYIPLSNCIFIDPSYVPGTTPNGTRSAPFLKFDGSGLGNGTAGMTYFYRRGTTVQNENLVIVNGIEDDWIQVGAYGQGARPIVDGSMNTTARRFMDIGSTGGDPGHRVRVFDIETTHDANNTWYPFRVAATGIGLEMHRIKCTTVTFENGHFWIIANSAAGKVNKQALLVDLESYDFRAACRGIKLEGGGIIALGCYCESDFTDSLTSVGFSFADNQDNIARYCYSKQNSGQGFNVRAINHVYEYCIIDGAANSLIAAISGDNTDPDKRPDSTCEFRNIIVRNSGAKVISFQRLVSGSELIDGVKFTNIIVQGTGAIGAEMLSFSRNIKLTNCVLAGLTGTGVRVFSGSTGNEVESCTIQTTATGINASEPVQVNRSIYNSSSGTITGGVGNSTNVSDFVGSGDFRIAEGSALIAATPRVTLFDALANDRYDPTTIGAFEYLVAEEPEPEPTFTLTLAIDPAESGTASQSPTGPHESGTAVTLTATPSSGKQFVGWYDGETLLSTANPYTYTTGAADKTITATFEDIPPVTYDITLSILPEGFGTAEKSPAGPQEEGTSYTLTATPASGKQFVRWMALFEGDWILLSTSNPLTANMPALDLYVRAEFEDIPAEPTFTLTLASDPAEGGSISQSPPSPHESLTAVTLTATPAEGYLFLGWYDNETLLSTDNPYTYTTGAEDKTITAVFELITYTLGITVNPSGAGTATGADTYAPGDSVPLVATANAGWFFSYWMVGGEVISIEPSFSYTMPAGNVTVTAFFEGSGPIVEPTIHALSLTATPSAQGTASGAGSYAAGSEVTVTATPILVGFGARFKYWKLDDVIVSYDAVYTFTMPDAPLILVAHFELSNLSPADPMDMIRDIVRFSLTPSIPAEGMVEMEGIVELEQNYGLGGWQTVAEYLNPYAYDLNRADFFVDRAILGRMAFHRPDLAQFHPVITSGIVKRYRIRHRLLVDGEQEGAQQLSPTRHAWLAGRPFTFPDVNPWEGKGYLFLTTRPLMRRVYKSEKLHFYVLPLWLGEYTLEEKIYYKNTTTQTTTRSLGTHSRYVPFYFGYIPPEGSFAPYPSPESQMSHDDRQTISKIELRLTGKPDTAEVITLIPTPDPQYPRQIVYGNSLGGFDSFMLSGKAEGSHLTTSELLETDLPPDHDRQEGTVSAYNQLSTAPLTLRTGYIPLPELEALRDMALLNTVYLVEGNQLRRIVLQASETSTFRDGVFLHSAEYAARYAHQNHSIYGRDPRL
jgi:hypothetical protein